MALRIYKHRFASSVAVSGDGLMTAIGSPEDYAVVLTSSGGTQLFEHIRGKDLPNNYQPGFGASVAMSEDGEHIVVGIPLIVKTTGTEEAPIITESGGFQMWKREPSGFTWGSAEHIALFDDLPVGTGSAVAITPDASIVAVACPDEDDDANCKIYVYYQQYEQFWPMTGSPLTGNGIGRSLAICHDGTHVIIATGTTQETVRTYVVNPVTFEFLTANARHDATAGTASGSGSGYGATVALSSDGNTLVVGEDVSNTIRTFRYSSVSPVGWSTDHTNITGKGWSVSMSADGLYLASVSELSPTTHECELVVHTKTNASDTAWTLFGTVPLEMTARETDYALDDYYSVSLARPGAPEEFFAFAIGIHARQLAYCYIVDETDTNMGSGLVATSIPAKTLFNLDNGDDEVLFSGIIHAYWS